MKQHPHSWLRQHLAVTGTGSFLFEHYLDGMPTSTARLEISTRNSDGQPAMLPLRAHLRAPIAVARTAPDPVPQFGGPARTTTPRFTRVHLIPAHPQPLSPPSVRQRISLEDSAILQEQLSPPDPPFRCPVFERLSEDQRLVHRCRCTRLGDLCAVLKHLVDEHMNSRCPICYDKLLGIKDLEIGHLKEVPAFFEKIQYAIAHIRCKHTKPWYCQVCNLRFGAKAKYNAHMEKNPAHNSLERIVIAGYYDKKTQASDEKLGKCSNKADLDDWECDRSVESRRYYACSNDGGFPASEGGGARWSATCGKSSRPSANGGIRGRLESL